VTTSFSLGLQAILRSAAGRAGLGVPARALSGLTPSAKAFYAATAVANGRRVFLVAPTDGDVEQLTTDARFFLTALEGATAATVEDQVLPLPSPQVDPYRGLATHLRVASTRARALHALTAATARLVVASAGALLPRVSPPDRLARASISIRVGQDLAPERLADLLVDAGFVREDPVDAHGEFAVRGGIVDLYPAVDAEPVRVEFIGDTIESIRRYDPATQRTIVPVPAVVVTPLRDQLDGVFESREAASILEYVDRSIDVVVSEPDDVRTHIGRLLEQFAASYGEATKRHATVPRPEDVLVAGDTLERWLDPAVRLEQLELASAGGRHVACQAVAEFRGRIVDWVADIRRARERGDTVVLVAATHGRAERTVELLAEYEVPATLMEGAEETLSVAVLVAVGDLSRGFRLVDGALQLYAEPDVFEEERRPSERRRSATGAFVSDLRDLKAGDHVVHVDHGIGVFVGLRQIGVGPGSDSRQEFLELRYAGEDKLFVPVERLDLIQKYSGGARPTLDRLGGVTWERAKTRVKKAMRDMAEELLKLYAERRSVRGHAFSPDSHWQREFEDAFAYELTADQKTAIAEIKRDMESPTPMDRLLCGDVGYGKTEVAMRAAFKAVMDGRQVAFLAPTTILAFQHAKTLRDRFAAFPARIELISRFRSKAEQKVLLTDLASGRIDIIVGTHRLLSKDVQFHNLGLLVVDEEQRFGVVHKERLKQIRRSVDVLTMSATPIPRTLNMSLVGIRDMSIIETPPKDRLSIQTHVLKFDQQAIARAIRTELGRGGQVYFVHNRVESIFSVGSLINRLVPEARLVVGHGKMGEAELEQAMLDFIDRKFDVLLATTIIENGLDIPNVNTILVNRADRYGLAQLYQLRGRVGRSDRPAYAYLLIPPEDSLSPIARRRLAAIREFSDLGSGFRVAALDLEIRGAGNLLGGEQSGHIDTVGFEMYMKLLEQTVRELKGEELEDDVRASINLHIDLRIDESYIPDMNQRLMTYRRAAGARSEAELDELLDEVRDRYGEPPPSVLNLADYARIRILADRLGIAAVDREGPTVVFKIRPQTPLDPVRVMALVTRRRDLALAPPATLKLDLRAAAHKGARPAARKPPATSRWQASWWTARATSGDVAPGFTRDQILPPQRDDPRAEDGLLPRVGDLLSELVEMV
jgi:transcription-repair coupling factor (superfamily II helicase)